MAPTAFPTCVILMGIPASGKSTFFRTYFGDTHVRINREMLGTPHRERLLVDACLKGATSFVVDKTNVTRRERGAYVQDAKAAGFRVEGYFLESRWLECADRNRLRPPEQQAPEAAVAAMSERMELPNRDEGFDALCFVSLLPDGGFDIVEWPT